MIRIIDYRMDFLTGSLIIPDLEIVSNGISLIVGDNGIGKTSFIRSILRINTEYKGKIYIEEIENTKLTRKEISG
ncbi:MAG: ABC transporter ATP-binding protein, partial [Brevinematia bacterium]